MRLMIDTNIFLDVLAEREPFFKDSKAVPLLGKADDIGHLDHLGALAYHQADGAALFQQLPCRGLLPDDLALGHGVAVFQRDIEEIIAHIAAVVPHLSVIIQPHEIGCLLFLTATNLSSAILKSDDSFDKIILKSCHI